MTEAELIAFEDEMTREFEAGQIRAPLHLAGGNEKILIEIFKEVKPEDWVLASWRSHYHCLLKGVPKEDVKKAILDGHSISLAFPKYNVLCSGIVGGIAPIGVGIAAALKANGTPGKVWVFVGDMTAYSGIFAESFRYAMGHNLPIEFVVEDNGLSVCTETEKSWGTDWTKANIIRRYQYKMTKPHVGIGKHIAF